MATAPNQSALEDEEYSKAFNEDQTGPREMTEDEAFSGLADDGTSSPKPGDAVVSVEGDGQPQDGAEAAAEPPAETAVAVTEEAAEEPMDPKDIQRQKSWEGRLKAREEELRMREEALAAGPKPAQAEVAIGEETAELSDDPGEAVAELAAAVADGDMTPEQAIKTLEEDFGPEFVKMLTVLVGAKASKAVDEKVGSVSKTVEQLIGELTSDKQRDHFEVIADAHPDFMDINGSEALTQYMASLPEDERAKAQEIQERGSARQIVKLLNGFKSWAETQGETAKPADAEDDGMGMGMGMGMDESAADAAEGVRSTGMTLPNAPDKDDSYESAWSKF